MPVEPGARVACEDEECEAGEEQGAKGVECDEKRGHGGTLGFSV